MWCCTCVACWLLRGSQAAAAVASEGCKKSGSSCRPSGLQGQNKGHGPGCASRISTCASALSCVLCHACVQIAGTPDQTLTALKMITDKLRASSSAPPDADYRHHEYDRGSPVHHPQDKRSRGEAPGMGGLWGCLCRGACMVWCVEGRCGRPTGLCVYMCICQPADPQALMVVTLRWQ